MNKLNIIQIGTNDGNDHVFDFITKNKENINNIILIDANEDCISQIKEKYKDFKCQILNYAVVPIDGCELLNFYIPTAKNLSAFSSINENHVVQHLHSTDLIKKSVNSISLNNLLEKYTDGTLDYLYIDAEGLDAQLLFSLNFNKFKIKNIYFEFIHTDGVVKAGLKCNTICYMLNQIGYKIEREGGYNLIATLL